MKTKPTLFGLRLSLIIVLIVCFATALRAAPQSTAPATPQTITDADGYQLLARIVVGKLQEMYGVPITYEDTRHVHQSELDKNDPMKLTPERVSITYTITPPSPDADLSTRKAAVGEVLRDVVQKYNAARGAEMYQITETDNGFHVIPTKFLDTSGKMEDFHSILDTPVTVEAGERTIAAVLDEITEQLNAATGKPNGFTISFRAVGPNLMLSWQKQKTTLSASNEPARSVLDRLFNAIPVTAAKPRPLAPERSDDVPATLSWELNTWRGPNDGGIMFIYVVRPPGTM